VFCPYRTVTCARIPLSAYLNEHPPMSADSPGAATPFLARVWADMNKQDFALITDAELGLAPGFREQFRRSYFEDLRRDAGDWPADRKRARDVIRYKWSGGQASLSEYENIDITDRAGIRGARRHKRIEMLPDPRAEGLVRALLGLVPPDRRRAGGTFGVNFFRTYSDVVTKPHKDNEEFIILYIMHRDGDGARSYLYPALPGPGDIAKSDNMELDRQLNPGDILIFRDDAFLHGATPLTPPPGGQAVRDALVCTVDYQTTYLAPEPAI
jgi:hypothetical protein